MDSQPPEDAYTLKRDYNASTRLSAMHFLYKDTQGYLLHPDVPVPPNPRIADVATGNGIWLLDVASSLEQPFALDGFDISLDQVPAPSSLSMFSSGSLRFHTWDLWKEPPAEFIGAFDIVHVRLISVLFQDNNPIPVIESLRKLLKPKGFLQWEEVDNVNCKVVVPSGERAPALEQALAQLAGSATGDWKHTGATMLNENGFVNAVQLHIQPKSLHGRHWTDIYLATWAELITKVMGMPESATTLGEKAMEEVRKGAFISCPIWIWVARKA